MVEYDMSRSTTSSAAPDAFEVSTESLETGGNEKENWFYFPNATEYQGYYKNIPEYQSALDAMCIYVLGKGYDVNNADKAILEGIRGRGNEVITSIFFNHFIMAKVNGDSFLEIIRNKKGTLVNLMPIGAERMRVVENKKGIIIGYDVREKTKAWRRISPQKIFHKTNERMGDEGRGKATVKVLKWIIDAMNESCVDARKVYHRNVFPLQIIEYDGEDMDKRDALLVEHKKAIENGYALVVPKGVLSIADAGVTIQDPIAWLNFLQNLYYWIIRIPKVIATGEGVTEVGGKMGYLTFEPFYTYEQHIYEAEIWNSLAIRIKFKRPPSLGGTVQEDEAKNTGQVAIQPNDAEATTERE